MFDRGRAFHFGNKHQVSFIQERRNINLAKDILNESYNLSSCEILKLLKKPQVKTIRTWGLVRLLRKKDILDLFLKRNIVKERISFLWVVTGPLYYSLKLILVEDMVQGI